MNRKKKRPRSPRAMRRQADREQARVEVLRERLFATEPGSAAARPIAVASASVIEPQAHGRPCPRCEGELRVEQHLATTYQGRRLREARVRCRQCGVARSLWFEIAETN